MLQFFRSFFKSRIGAVVAIGILVLIALAFTSGDVANTGTFGGVAGGNRVASVGDQKIDTSTLSQAVTSALDRVQDDNPTMSMKAFLAEGGLEDVLDELVSRTAIAVFGAQNGIFASDRLVDSEIANMAAFQGPDGQFSQDAFRQLIQQRGISEQMVREDLRQGLIARQVMMPASFGAVMPRELATRYAALLQERREGSIAAIPSLAYAPEEEPTDQQLAAYYRENQQSFIRPERRVLRYASFDASVLKNVPAPTASEIAFRYNANKQRYAAVEKRRISQLIVPTEAAANSVIAEVGGGTSLEDAAKAKGLAVASLESFDKQGLAQQTSQAVANVVFAAQQRAIAGPARSGLGWHIVRVEEIDRQPARSLDDVREEIAAEIAAEKTRVAIGETLERVEDEFDSGAGLTEVAKSLGLEVTTTKPVTADGRIYLTADSVPEEIRPVLETAFAMDLERAQLTSLGRGERYIMFDVTDIAASAPAPLKEIRDNVVANYMLDKGFEAAKAAAQKVQAQVRKGSSLAEALTSLDKRVPPPQPVSMARPQLAQIQQQGQQIPPPIALMFSMAEGTTKVQPSPNKQAWFVVTLKDIVPGEVTADDPMLRSAQRELGSILGSEYSQALQRAIRAEVGVSRNEAGIRAVREQLDGGS